MKKPLLSSELILNKKFDTALNGYNADEVDQFFDLILQDYQTYEEIVKQQDNDLTLSKQILNDKKQEIEQLKLDLFSLRTDLKRATKQGINIESISKRLIKLEQKYHNDDE